MHMKTANQHNTKFILQMNNAESDTARPTTKECAKV